MLLCFLIKYCIYPSFCEKFDRTCQYWRKVLILNVFERDFLSFRKRYKCCFLEVNKQSTIWLSRINGVFQHKFNTSANTELQKYLHFSPCVCPFVQNAHVRSENIKHVCVLHDYFAVLQSGASTCWCGPYLLYCWNKVYKIGAIFVM